VAAAHDDDVRIGDGESLGWGAMTKVAGLFLATLALAAPAHAGTVQQRMVKIATAELARNVQEIPADSNLGPDISRYHRAVRHAPADYPWCAIFVSWVTRQAGYPLGNVSQGIAEVGNLFKWGREHGYYFAKGSREVKVGDISLHGYGHAGIVVSVDPVVTIDGNWSDTVLRQPVPYISLTGYLRLPGKPRK
jgi:hypothetical protein